MYLLWWCFEQDNSICSIQSRDLRGSLETADCTDLQDKGNHGHGLLQSTGNEIYAAVIFVSAFAFRMLLFIVHNLETPRRGT